MKPFILMSAIPLSLLEKIEKWAVETPHKIAMSFLNDSGDVMEGSSMTYLDISVRSSNLAAHLMSGKYRLRIGDR